MISPIGATDSGRDRCLDDDDLYNYVAGSSGARSHAEIESHLSNCTRCRFELAEVLRMLGHESPVSDESQANLSDQEIEKTLTLIDRAAQQPRAARARLGHWNRWGAAAAAIFVTIGLSLGAFQLYLRYKSRVYCADARSLLREVYAPRSPSDLRLDLPFSSAATQRASSGADFLQGAERLFIQSTTVRPDTREARLGLGYIYLRRGEYAQAEKEFRTALEYENTDIQALVGLGVSRFEGGIRATDPAQRAAQLGAALENFEGALKLRSESAEARFNMIRVLYELGRQKQALDEIEKYLARDSGSIWATKLNALKSRMLMNTSEVIEKEIHRAARARDAPALQAFVSAGPYRIPPMIRELLFQSFAIQDQPPPTNAPTAEDLRWAANVLIAGYSAETGDIGQARLVQFYDGLSPLQRRTKRALDASLERLIERFTKNDSASTLRLSESLLNGFEKLQDFWDLVRVHQLRGTAYFYGGSDFAAAGREYLEMLDCAEKSADSDLIARSLAAIATSLIEQNQYDQALTSLSRLKALAEQYRLESWSASVTQALGATHLNLGQYGESFQEYSSALQLFNRLLDRRDAAWCLKKLGELSERMSRYDDARRYYQESDASLDGLLAEGQLNSNPQIKTLRLSLQIDRGYLALRVGDLNGAESSFKNALGQSFGGLLDLEARDRLGLAHVHLEQKRFAESKAEVDAVFGIISGRELPDVAWQASSLRGYLLKQEGDYASALDSFEHAVQILEQMRANVSSNDLRRSFFNERYDPAREVVSLLFRLRKEPSAILDYADRAKCLTLREYLALRHGSYASQSSLKFTRRDARFLLPPPAGIVMLEYFCSRDATFAFIAGSRGADAVSLNLRYSDLTRTAGEYLDSIKSGDGARFDALSRALHNKLITPVLPYLSAHTIDTLVIIPDGPLYSIPFGSLLDAQGEFLLEKFPLSFAPSRTVLRYCLSMNRSRRLPPNSSILLLDGTANLPAASNELAEVAKTYSAGSTLVGPVDLARLDSIVGKYDAIHFSGHAEIHGQRPRLIFQGSPNAAYLDSSVIEKWNLPRNCLVSLLGCSSGVGPVSDGEAAWGLVPAFLNAGAPTILVSLLPLDDAAAARITTEFYSLLARGADSKAGALRTAQLSLLRSAGIEGRRRPGSWAPLVLLGDPR